MSKEVFTATGFEQKPRLRQRLGHLGATLLFSSSLLLGGCKSIQQETLAARMIGDRFHQSGVRIVVIGGWNVPQAERYRFLLSHYSGEPGEVIATFKKNDDFLDVPQDFKPLANALVRSANPVGNFYVTLVNNNEVNILTVEACGTDNRCITSNPVVIPN